MSALPPDVPIIGRPQHIPVSRRDIISPADIKFNDNGMMMDGCDYHLRVVNLITGEVHYIPFSHTVGIDLSNALDALVMTPRPLRSPSE